MDYYNYVESAPYAPPQYYHPNNHYQSFYHCYQGYQHQHLHYHTGSVRKLEALSPRQRSRGQVARSRRQQQQQCELPESYKYLHQRSNAPATITSSYENVMQAQTSSRTSTSYPDLMQRHVDGDGMPHYLKSNYHHMSPTVSGNNSCYHPHQQYQQQPLRRSFGHPGSIQATMRDSYNNHHSTTNHNEMQWTSSYYGNTTTSQGGWMGAHGQLMPSNNGTETNQAYNPNNYSEDYSQAGRSLIYPHQQENTMCQQDYKRESSSGLRQDCACKIKQDDKKETKKADTHKSEDTKTLPTFEEAFGSTEIGKFCNRGFV